LTSLNFTFDLLAAIPVSLVLTEKNFAIELLPMLKLLSLWKINLNFGHSEIVKVLLKLLGLLLTLLLYVNFSSCLIYFIASKDQNWVPPAYAEDHSAEEFYHSSKTTRYLHTLYSAILVLTGNEMQPKGDLLTALACIMTVLGSLIIANIFGTFAVVMAALNRKSSKFQEKIDTANSSMMNMKIPESLQDEIRQFMVSTQNNLDN